MSKLTEIADKYVAGGFELLNGVGEHDAVHQLAMVYDFDKAQVRAAIRMAEHRAQKADEPEYLGQRNAQPEGAEVAGE